MKMRQCPRVVPEFWKGGLGEGVFNQSINQSTLSNFDARKNARYARFMRVKVQPYNMTTSLSSYSSIVVVAEESS